MHRLQDLVRLHREGKGARQVARALNMSPNTERDYRRALEAAELLRGLTTELPTLEELKKAVCEQRPPPSSNAHELSSIAPWQDEVQKLMVKGLKPRAIYDHLRLHEKTFKGSYWAVGRMYRRLNRNQGVRAEDVAIPVETGPGEICQVDFGYVGKLLCPSTHVLRKAWVFVMVLCHSRHMFAEVVFDQKTETWLDLHIRGFEGFGGVPNTIVPDNLKAAVTRAAFGIDGDTALNRSYRELARYYGFMVDPTPPYAPRKKGKVESAVKYIKHNALAGRAGEDITVVNKTLKRWLLEIAGQRVHGTTGRTPLSMFHEQEASELRPLPRARYERCIWKQARVHRDTHVSFEGSLYSVPWRWVGQQVWIQATPSTVAIFGEDTRIATHRRTSKGTRSTVDAHLPEHRRDLRHRSRSYWEERAASIGPETAELVKQVFDSDDVLSQLRKVQGIVTHLETFPPSRAEAASRRAVFYGTLSYQGVKSILTKALDFEPLPAVPVQVQQDQSPPRFARSTQELLARAWERYHEPH